MVLQRAGQMANLGLQRPLRSLPKMVVHEPQMGAAG